MYILLRNSFICPTYSTFLPSTLVLQPQSQSKIKKIHTYGNRRPSVFSIFSVWLGGNENENPEINTMLSEDQIKENRRSLSHSARTLSAIVIMYVVCNIPRLIVNLAEYLYRFQLYQNYSECGCVKNIVWMEVFLRVSPLLLTLNSSVNFIIYWSIGKQFKSTLSRILKKIRCRSSITSNHVDV